VRRIRQVCPRWASGVGLAAVFVVVLAGCRVPPATDADVARTVALGNASTHAYGPEPAQQLDVHRTAGTSRGTILFVPGGGWLTVDRRAPLVHPAIALQHRNGWDIVSMSYRVAPSHRLPAPAYDVRNAIRWLRSNSEALGIDMSTFIVSGHSAGGHLAMLGALGEPFGGLWTAHPEPVEVDAVIALAAPGDLAAWSTTSSEFFGYTAPGVTELVTGCGDTVTCPSGHLDTLSPIRYLDDSAPPAYIAHAVGDDVVPVALGDALAAAWTAARGDTAVWYDRVDPSGHATERTNATWLGRFLEAVASGALDRQRPGP
jgi:acetyl esterase/lipase